MTKLFDEIMRTENITVSVDPGVNTGVAVFVDETTHPCGWFDIRPDNKADYYPQCHNVVDAVSRWLLNTFPMPRDKRYTRTLAIEYPSVFGSSRGLASRDSVIKLAVMTGMTIEAFRIFDFKIVHVPVNDWKGQLKKEVCHARILKILGDDMCEKLNIKKSSGHALDAIGIGLHHLGHTI